MPIDVMGTQVDIVKAIIEGKTDYCLAVKGNQRSLQEDISLYFSDVKLLNKFVQKGCHYQITRRACGESVEKSGERVYNENKESAPQLLKEERLAVPNKPLSVSEISKSTLLLAIR